jgi:hypothetical protein
MVVAGEGLFILLLDMQAAQVAVVLAVVGQTEPTGEQT